MTPEEKEARVKDIFLKASELALRELGKGFVSGEIYPIVGQELLRRKALILEEALTHLSGEDLQIARKIFAPS